MNVEELIHQFMEHQYAASELPGGLDGPAIARLFGERIQQRSEIGEGVVEIGATCICQSRSRARSLIEKFRVWLDGRGHRLAPVDCEGKAEEGWITTCYRIEGK